MPAADRDLLFGLIALQNGLIDQEQLLAAFRARTREAGSNLADQLRRLGHLDDRKGAAVEAMVALHLKDTAEAQATNDDTTRLLLPDGDDSEVTAILDHLGPEARGGETEVEVEVKGDADDPDRTMVVTDAPDGRRYRILRPHARGGLVSQSLARAS